MRYRSRYRGRPHLFGLAIALGVFYLFRHPWLVSELRADIGSPASIPASFVSGPSAEVHRPAALPNASLTPGALNPAVTPSDLYSTICRHGWTRTIRPAERYTERLKREQIREYGYANRRLGAYEEDHLVSLELGGSPSSPENLWPEPHNAKGGWGSYAKDRLENRLNHLVCDRRLALGAAQRMIATNWIAAYQRYIGPSPYNHPTY